MLADATPWINLGIGGMFLVLLFLGLRSGAIHTRASVDQIMKIQEKRHEDKDRYIAKLEEINDKQGQRNDALASKFDQLLEISRAHGMIDALPPSIGERIVK